MSPEFLTLDDVLFIHDRQLERYGGADGVRDRGLLESAIVTAQASFGGEFLHQDLFEMASAYAFHIAQNQPFLDGNKRTALVAALAFLDLNNVRIDDPEQKLYFAMIDLAERRATKNSLAVLFKNLHSAE